jgi:hypothetical protein
MYAICCLISGGEYLPAYEPEKRPDHTEGVDDLIGVDAFPLSVGRPSFLRPDFNRLAVNADHDLFYRHCAQDADSVFPVVTSEPGEFVQQSLLLFFGSLLITCG